MVFALNNAVLKFFSMDFSLRPFHPDDAESIAFHANDFNIARFTSDAFPHPYELSDAVTFIRGTLQLQPQRIFAIIVEDKAVGGIGVHPQEGVSRLNAEIGYWLGKSYWGQGIITRAIPLVVDYAFQHFELIRIYAKVFGNNGASQRVLEKCGFTLEARIRDGCIKMNEMQDELIYAIRRSPRRNEDAG
jgi:[ribosomal protein S5]-alanine N-acetyltransferase